MNCRGDYSTYRE